MKLTKDGKTLFQALCELFTNKVGHDLNKRAFGDHSSLIAIRDHEGKIETINLLFRKTTIMTIENLENRVFLDATSWFTQATINRMNKALILVGLKICKQNNAWMIEDAQGQVSPFRNAEQINLSRPHGAALYEQE